MAGGTWIDQNKVRPGVYINYKSAPASLATMGERGVVAIARVMDWGEQGKFYTIEDPSDCAKLGHAITDDEMLFIRQILLGSNRTQGATKILLWNLAQSANTSGVSASNGSSSGGYDYGEPIRTITGCHLDLDAYNGLAFGRATVFDADGNIVLTDADDGFYFSPENPNMRFVPAGDTGILTVWLGDKNAIIGSAGASTFTINVYQGEPHALQVFSGCRTDDSNSDPATGASLVLTSSDDRLSPVDGAFLGGIDQDGALFPGDLDGDPCVWGYMGADAPATFDVTAYALPSSGTDGASKASVTIGNLTATALYDGTFGNRLSLSVTAGEGGTFIVQTLLDGQVVDSQTVSGIAGLVANEYCTFSGEGEITTTTSPVAFSGGSTGAPTATAYSDFLNALELQKFDVVIYDGEDATIKGAFIDFVKRLSNREGVKCQAVVSDATNPDNECVINVYPQAVTLTDGTQLAASELTWWVGGASAGANVYESLTYAAYPDAIEVNPVLTSSQQEDAINAGKFALIAQFDRIQVLTDINSFVTFAVEKGKAFRKNRVIRTVFGLCNDIYKAFATYYIGAVHNDEEGRNSLKAEILNLMNRYQGNRALQNVNADDVTVLAGVDSDAVVIEIYIQPVDSIEKIYINITIS